MKLKLVTVKGVPVDEVILKRTVNTVDAAALPA